eukprot:TRINITY_DN18986_c0_g1_i1.p1 TRINITY_DN18986_c0_g1~~TRINITY_DN18986_c0_g1_i1.p1  ORF type:complete len:368 (-),score=75.27 TRINITY_DN18986_c0_g1_i1:128-1231(-)
MTGKHPQQLEYYRSREEQFVASSTGQKGFPEYDPFRDRHLKQWYARQQHSKPLSRSAKPRRLPHSSSLDHRARTVPGIRNDPPSPLGRLSPPVPDPQQPLTLRSPSTPGSDLSHTIPSRTPQLEPLSETSPRPVPYCKQHPEEQATVLSEKFGFLCYQCDAFLHRTWRTSGLRRTPLQGMSPGPQLQGRRAPLEGKQPSRPGTTGLLKGQSALDQLLEMESRSKLSKKARMINGEFIGSYTQEYEQRELHRQRLEQVNELSDEEAAVRLQRITRGTLGRAQAAEAKRAKAEARQAAEAATRIQSRTRGVQARVGVKRRELGASTLQRNYRGHRVRRQITEGKQSAASILIQAQVRGAQARKLSLIHI